MPKHASTPKISPPKPRRVQTTLVLTEDLWRAVKIRAVEEHRDFRDVCITALEAYLATPMRPR